MKLFYPLSSIFFIFLIACNTPKNDTGTVEEGVEHHPDTERSVATTKPQVTGFDTIEELAASALESIRKNDHEGYYSHTMTEEIEIRMADMIQDSTTKQEFIHEYGFSLKEEKEYFDYLIKYFTDKNIDLNKAALDDMEYTEYKHGKYEPVMLYEVFIPIEMDYELLIDFTAIQVEGKYFLTSELGL